MIYKFVSKLLLLNYFCPSFGWTLDGKSLCASLFSGQNFTGEQMPIFSGNYLSDLNDVYLNSILKSKSTEYPTWTNSTRSIQINQSCALNIWSVPYSDGNNTVLTQNNRTDTLDSDLENAIGSLHCMCATNCESNKCPNVHLKKGECARAFIEKGCNTCKGIYVDLKPINKTFIGNYGKGNKIHSLIVRSGCQLIAYDDRDFEGADVWFNSGIYENFNVKIESFNCTCSEARMNKTIDTEESKIQPSSTSLGPMMIEIPATSENMTTMLRNQYSRHPGLMAALRSYKNGRSSRNAYILLLGMTGSGKSATINFLFDNVTIAEVGATESTTSQINEYRIPVPVDELGIRNSELRVIDTPGLGDTRGMENDAQFLASLDDFLDNHEDLKDRIPNIVMIFAKFNLNRFVGPGAPFVKMLRGLDSFSKRLFDKKYSNVIIVLSHYMSVTKNLQKNPSTRLKDFKECVQEYSLFPKPVVVTVAENKPEDQELPMVNGFYKLPNGDFYPRNLFDKIQQAAANGGDPIGEAIIRNGFKEPEKFKVTKFNYSLVDLQHSKVSKYLSLLSLNNYKVEETEISTMLEKAFNGMSQKLKRKYPDTLPYLQRSLNIRNIVNKNDIPKTNAAIIDLLKDLRQSELVIQLLEKGLQIKVPRLEISLLIGQSYDIMQDAILPSSPFAITSYQISDIGYLLPNTLSCKIQNSIAKVYQIYDTEKEYYLARLKSLSTDDGINVDEFKAKPKVGYNILPPENGTSPASETVLTAIWEHRLFELTLNEASVNFTDHYKETVENITPFNSSDYESVDAWKRFFARYGTHVVKSAYGGGVIEINARNIAKTANISETKEATGKTLINLVQFAEDVSVGVEDGFSLENSNTTKFSLTFRGGDYKLHTSDLEQLGVSGAFRLLDNWKDSLVLQPTMLQTTMKLVPISEFAKRISDDAYVRISNAAVAMFNANLTYKPIPPPPPPPPRVDTEILETLIHSQSKQMENLLSELSSQRIKNDNLMAEIQMQIQSENDRRDAETIQLLDMIHQQNEILKNKGKLISNLWCLKAGTKILMNGGQEKNIEFVKPGDYILNKEFKPVRVIAAVKWFLGKLRFYGFDETNQFFTNTHLFVGPSDKLYTVSRNDHIAINPLMKFADLNDMKGIFEILKQNSENKNGKSASVIPVNCTLFEDPIIYPEDTLVYFIELDSSDGSYIANGFVARHELPDFSKWPNAISVLIIALSTPAVQEIKHCRRNIDNYHRLNELANLITLSLKNLINEEGNEYVKEEEIENCTVENSMLERIFDNDLFSSFAISLYSKSVEILAEKLDNEHHLGHLLVPNKIFVNRIISVVDSYLRYTKMCTEGN